MISYTIDQSLFTPPVIHPIEDNNVISNHLKNEYYEKIIKYADSIRKVYEIKDIEGIVVYLFSSSELSLPREYIKKASGIGIKDFPIDEIEPILTKLSDLYFPYPDQVPNINDSKKKKCYLFEDRFNFDELVYKNASIEPALKNQKSDTSEDVERIIKIGILNHYIYKKSSMHFLIKDESSKYTVNCTKLKFLLNNSLQKEEETKLDIQVLNITDIDCNNNLQFETVDEAYKYAKNSFSGYLIFGKDVEKGIKTIRNSAGPPERIFYYLQTLKEYCEYKRNFKTNFPDDYILKSFGCDCSYEKPEHMQNKRAQDERMYDNGNDEKKLFELHLKPSTFSPYEDMGNKTRTTRIYILWDENVKKVIVGWIGNHPYLPPKNH